MSKCTRCEYELPPDAVFCPQCALPVPAAAAPAPVGITGPVGVVTISGLQTIPGVAPRTGAVLSEGQVFYKYTIERQLGAGAMGVVYAAREKLSAQPVALKLISPALADRPASRERFIREGVTARSVRHPNVVAMYDVGEVDGQVYLAMEYVAGETLRKWLRRELQERRDVPFDTARGIIRAVLEGLAAAHAASVVHRDLKPENVMLMGDPQAGDYRLKILDFGIARDIGASNQATTTSASTGTPLYMAPEQKTAADTVGPPADLYAVTAMLYEILIGVAPEGRWGAPSKERKDLPPGIDEIVDTGLASRPRSRYQTAEDYIRALDGVARPVAPQEPPAPPAPPQPPPPQPPPPVPPAPDSPTASTWDWLVRRSRAQAPKAWALWDRMSTAQRLVVIAVTIAAVLVTATYCEQQRIVRPSDGPLTQQPPPEKPTSVTPPPETPPGTETAKTPGKDVKSHGTSTTQTTSPPPLRPAFVNIAGRWGDEVAGTGVAVGYVDIGQQEQVVGGPVYNMQGYQVATFQGRVDGTGVEYSYLYANGVTGTGRGRLRADGIHLDVEVQDQPAGARVRHTLHRQHWPPL